MPRLFSALAAVLIVPLIVSTAHADPSGKTTLEETLQPAAGSGFLGLQPAKGEKYVVRKGGSAKATAKRTKKRRSLVSFVQLTDPQIADEMSPARVDFADPAGGELKSSWRPQEALGLQAFDSVVRNVNANRRSRVKQGDGKRAKTGFAITTGDLADNQQLNETRWFKGVLDGGTVDPFSGQAISAANPCSTASPAQVNALNAAVANRQ